MNSTHATHLNKWFTSLLCFAFLPIVPISWILAIGEVMIAIPMALASPFMVYHGTRVCVPTLFDGERLHLKCVLKRHRIPLDEIEWFMILSTNPFDWNTCPVLIKKHGFFNYFHTRSDEENNLLTLLKDAKVREKGLFYTPPKQ